MGTEEHELIRFIGRGIEAAIREQVQLYESGGSVEQHTYDYEPDTDKLTPHRSKEEAEDYRYFPEPDLVPLEPEPALVERLRGELPALPADLIRERAEELGVDDAWALVTTDRDPAYAGLVAAGVPAARGVQLRDEPADPGGCELRRAREGGQGGEGSDARGADRRRRGERGLGFTADEYLAQTAVSDTSELEPVIEAILAANPGQVEAYKGGKDGLLGFFVAR